MAVAHRFSSSQDEGRACCGDERMGDGHEGEEHGQLVRGLWDITKIRPQ